MSLRLGSNVACPPLAGRWSVWSKADDAPGAHFVVPADIEARSMGVTYAVIRATTPRGAPTPLLELLRTDPHLPDLFTDQEKKKR